MTAIRAERIVIDASLERVRASIVKASARSGIIMTFATAVIEITFGSVLITLVKFLLRINFYTTCRALVPIADSAALGFSAGAGQGQD
jgi:hypothetical protein